MTEHSDSVARKEGTTAAGHQATVKEESESNNFILIL